MASNPRGSLTTELVSWNGSIGPRAPIGCIESESGTHGGRRVSEWGGIETVSNFSIRCHSLCGSWWKSKRKTVSPSSPHWDVREAHEGKVLGSLGELS